LHGFIELIRARPQNNIHITQREHHMLTQKNIILLTKRAELTGSIDLSLWAALGMEDTDIYWFIKAFSKETIKLIKLETSFETLNSAFYEKLFAYLETYETADKQPVTLKFPIKSDIKTGQIHNLQLIYHFLQSAKGLWQVEFSESLCQEKMLKKIKLDWECLFNIIHISPTVFIKKLKIHKLSASYMNDILSFSQTVKLKNLEIIAQKIDGTELDELGLILQQIQVQSLHVSLEPKEKLETLAGKFLSTISQNSHIKKLKLHSTSAIILNEFPEISANNLKELNLSDNMMANLHFLNIALQKDKVLSQVEQINLENCNLMTSDVKTILANTQIRIANLSGNRLTENIFDVLCDNVALDSLNIRSNPFIDPNIFIEKLLNFINSNKVMSTLSIDPVMPLSNYGEISDIRRSCNIKEDWLSRALLKFHSVSYNTSAQQLMEQRNRILSAYKKNPALKIILPTPNKWLLKIDQEKELLNRPERTWLAKQVFFKLSHVKDQPAGIGVENIISKMANLPSHTSKSFLNALRRHKNDLPKPSIVNKLTHLFVASNDERFIVSQLENCLSEDRYTECITFAASAANNASYTIAFRNLCRELAGILKDLACDNELSHFKIV